MGKNVAICRLLDITLITGYQCNAAPAMSLSTQDQVGQISSIDEADDVQTPLSRKSSWQLNGDWVGEYHSSVRTVATGRFPQ